MVLKFNEGLACEAIVSHLEKREKGVRGNLRWPEAERHPFPIEVALTIGDQLYALEHTGIEPFKGHVQMEAEAERLFAPIKDALNGNLDTAAVFELHIPVNALQGLRTPKVQSIQQAVIDWVKATAPTVPKPLYAHRGHSVGPVNDAPGIPFPVSLYRFEPVLIPGHHFQIKHTVSGGDQARADRMKQAIEDKFPKLAAWKNDDGARTILVLEDNDIQLTNPSIVTDTFVPLAKARTDRPDETYLVISCMDPWHACPIMIDDKTFFDLAQQHEANVLWQIDKSALTPLTKR